MANPVKPQAAMTKNGQPFYPLTTIDQVLDSGGNRLSVDSTIQVYTHTKTNSVHNFVGTGANGRAKITADFASGDTFAVNGTAVTAYWGSEAPDGDLIAKGRWVSFIVDGTTINFKPGGGLTNSKLAQATATESDVLSGKTFYASSKNIRTGNIASKAAESKTITPSSSSQSYTFATSGKMCTGNMSVTVNGITPPSRMTYVGWVSGDGSYYSAAANLTNCNPVYKDLQNSTVSNAWVRASASTGSTNVMVDALVSGLFLITGYSGACSWVNATAGQRIISESYDTHQIFYCT